MTRGSDPKETRTETEGINSELVNILSESGRGGDREPQKGGGGGGEEEEEGEGESLKVSGSRFTVGVGEVWRRSRSPLWTRPEEEYSDSLMC